VRVEWGDAYAPEGALIPMTLQVSSGYGEYQRSGAVSADGRFLVLGEPLPYDKDPVAYRRDMLRSNDLVIWDHGPADATVQIVEFSDFECPGCKLKWGLLETALERYGASVRHGMVAFPLTSMHPWAFRAACAGWCVADQSPEALLPMKELFYSLQSEMTVSDVTPTASDFVEGQGLSTESFTECYLRPPSLNAVHDQMSLGRTLGVDATPTYFINGWKVQVPERTWLMPMIERLISEAAEGR
jgi:protein-disulfide isomerase